MSQPCPECRGEGQTLYDMDGFAGYKRCSRGCERPFKRAVQVWPDHWSNDDEPTRPDRRPRTYFEGIGTVEEADLKNLPAPNYVITRSVSVGDRVEVEILIIDPRNGSVPRRAIGRVVGLDQIAVIVDGEEEARAFEPGKVFVL